MVQVLLASFAGYLLALTAASILAARKEEPLPEGSSVGFLLIGLIGAAGGGVAGALLALALR